jgi:hypothetical protein
MLLTLMRAQEGRPDRRRDGATGWRTGVPLASDWRRLALRSPPARMAMPEIADGGGSWIRQFDMNVRVGSKAVHGDRPFGGPE